MKKLLSIVLLALPLFVWSQDSVYGEKKKDKATTGIKAPKKTNLIIVSNDKSAEDNFVFAKKILATNNIEIASQDKDVYQIKTGDIAVSKHGANEYLILSCRDKSITIKGMYKSGIELNLNGIKTVDNYTPIENRGMGGSITKGAFEKMDSTAKLFGLNISYETLN